jgi:hypothetical protein
VVNCGFPTLAKISIFWAIVFDFTKTFIKKENPFFIHSLRCGKVMDDFRSKLPSEHKLNSLEHLKPSLS